MSTIRIDHAVAACAKEGEADSGDSYLIRRSSEGVWAAAIDGLGHGAEAAATADMAKRALESAVDGDIRSMLRHCHEALIGSRGAVASVAELREMDRSLIWAGIGNVQGMLIRGNQDISPATESLIPRPGILGNGYFDVRPAKKSLAKGDTIVLTTDGIRPFPFKSDWRGVSVQKMAEDILSEYSTGDDDALVLVLRCMGIAL